MKKHFKDGATHLGKTGLKVDVRNNNMDQALKALKRKVMQEGLIKEMRRLEYYEPPGVKRRREKSDAIKRANKKKAMQDNNL